MKIKTKGIILFLIVAISGLFSTEVNNTVNEKCNGLSNSFLKDAYLVKMDKDVILKTEGLIYKTKDLNEEILKNNDEKIRKQLENYKFYLLEQVVTGKILFSVGNKELIKLKIDTKKMSEDDVIREYLTKITASINVSDKELKKFYDENSAMMGGASFESIKAELYEYVVNQKKQDEVNQIIKNLGKSQKIELNRDWALNQCKTEKNNIVDKTRFSGKPSLIDFGSKGCGPCDMMAPILEKLGNQYKGKINVVVAQANDDQILSSKYGVRTIPVQIFFDKNGNEVYRHTGFFSESDIEQIFKELKFK